MPLDGTETTAFGVTGGPTMPAASSQSVMPSTPRKVVFGGLDFAREPFGGRDFAPSPFGGIGTATPPE